MQGLLLLEEAGDLTSGKALGDGYLNGAGIADEGGTGKGGQKNQAAQDRKGQKREDPADHHAPGLESR